MTLIFASGISPSHSARPAPDPLSWWAAPPSLCSAVAGWLGASWPRCPGAGRRLRQPYTGCYLLSSPQSFLAWTEVGVGPGVRVGRIFGSLVSL